MPADYAVLQLYTDRAGENSQSALIGHLTAMMKREGLSPCGREEAEQTVAFAPCAAGWAVYDDCAERLCIPSMDTLGRGLSRRLRCRGAGLLFSNGERLMRLYANGRTRDTYITSRQMFGGQIRLYAWADCRRHALHWRPLLKEPAGVRELAETFSQGQHAAGQEAEPPVFERLRTLLGMDRAACYGFKSLELEQPEGLVTLYFACDTTVKQKLTDRLFGTARGVGTTAGACLRQTQRADAGENSPAPKH